MACFADCVDKMSAAREKVTYLLVSNDAEIVRNLNIVDRAEL